MLTQKLGNTIRYTANITNLKKEGLGISSGTSIQPWQLK